MYSKKTKTMTHRLLQNHRRLLVSDQGDLSDYATTVWRGDRKPRRWLSVDTKGSRHLGNLITKADRVELVKDQIKVTHGTAVTLINAEPVGELPDVTKKPEGMSFTLDSYRGENLMAIKALAACKGSDDTMPSLTRVKMVQESTGRVTGSSTDRYVAASTILQTVSKPVDFNVLVPGALVQDLAFNTAWHLTVWEHYSMAVFCDTGITVQQGNVPGDEYPRVDTLFPLPENTGQVTVEVSPREYVRSLSRMPHSSLDMMGLSATGEVAADGSGVRPVSGVVQAVTSGEHAAWVELRPAHLIRLCRAVSDAETAVIQWGANPTKPVMVTAGDDVRMLAMPSRGGGRSYAVSESVEL